MSLPPRPFNVSASSVPTSVLTLATSLKVTPATSDKSIANVWLLLEPSVEVASTVMLWLVAVS